MLIMVEGRLIWVLRGSQPDMRPWWGVTIKLEMWLTHPSSWNLMLVQAAIPQSSYGFLVLSLYGLTTLHDV